MNSEFFMEFSSYKKYIELKSYAQLEEHDCPFYGFGTMGNSMVEVGRGQCALDESSGLCQMEMWKTTPDWLACPLNTRMNRIAIEMGSEDIRVFPKEYYPPGAGAWVGIPLVDWIRRTIGRID